MTFPLLGECRHCIVACGRCPDVIRAEIARGDSRAEALRAAQEEAHAILALTISAEGGRQFVDRGDFDKCLAFLARLSGDDQWAFLAERAA